MLSVPLTWHDTIVGVLNVQTEKPRVFSPSDVDQLSAIADLLAGIVEKGRTQLEAEAQVEALKALDEARTELIALVTHELRTPLAVVRAYTDLLSEEPPLVGRESRDMIRRRTREEWHNRAIDQIERLDRLVDSILASVRPLDERPSDVVPVDVGALLDEVIVGLRPLLRNHRMVVSGGLSTLRPGRPATPPPGRGAPRRERREVRPARHDHHGRHRARRGAWSGSASRTRVLGSRPSGASGSSSRTPDGRPTPPAGPGSACSPPSAAVRSRWAAISGASPPIRPGARFVIALPAAVAV